MSGRLALQILLAFSLWACGAPRPAVEAPPEPVAEPAPPAPHLLSLVEPTIFSVPIGTLQDAAASDHLGFFAVELKLDDTRRRASGAVGVLPLDGSIAETDGWEFGYTVDPAGVIILKPDSGGNTCADPVKIAPVRGVSGPRPGFTVTYCGVFHAMVRWRGLEAFRAERRRAIRDDLIAAMTETIRGLSISTPSCELTLVNCDPARPGLRCTRAGKPAVLWVDRGVEHRFPPDGEDGTRIRSGACTESSFAPGSMVLEEGG